ncbi:hypothetical protein Golax_018895, partial [Gossypium laxum]|nr:hypothetical protein [Gossypium laxum]
MCRGKARKLTFTVISVTKKQWRTGIKQHWRRLWSQRGRSISRTSLLI